MTDISIPAGALEAGADFVRIGLSMKDPDPVKIARAAFLAMIEAWPGMKMTPYWEHMTHKRHVEMILPLTETADDKA